ncbi:MAG: chemotaxis protein CheW [Sedimentisphaerales bacterium]|nr:chemotaxis protein CheW [Sedimentisphaerales bacterium]
MSSDPATLSVAAATAERELVTFYIGDLLMGIDIQQVQEIHSHLELTGVPQAPSIVRGVINLRGQVVTILDLRRILDLGQTDPSGQNRTVVIRQNKENLGLLVDRLGDVITISGAQIESPPANVNDVDSQFFEGICALPSNLLMILQVDKIVNHSA